MFPVLGHPTLADACQALRSEGLSDVEIAGLVGREPVQVRASLSSRDYAKTPRTIVLPMELMAELAAPAAARGMDERELALALLETIASDDLFEALLGEPDVRQVHDERGDPAHV